MDKKTLKNQITKILNKLLDYTDCLTRADIGKAGNIRISLDTDIDKLCDLLTKPSGKLKKSGGKDA